MPLIERVRLLVTRVTVVISRGRSAAGRRSAFVLFLVALLLLAGAVRRACTRNNTHNRDISEGTVYGGEGRPGAAEVGVVGAAGFASARK